MNGRRSLLIDPDPPPVEPGREDIIWASSPGPMSFHTNLDPDLASLGDVSAANRDAVRLAVLVFIADRTLKRPMDWTRIIELDLPVDNPDGWNGPADEITLALNRLTSDNWSFQFRPDDRDTHVASGHDDTQDEVGVDLVCLLSGGADSMCGAIRALDEGHRPLFVSHWDAPATAEHQKKVIEALRSRFGEDAFEHVQIRVGAARMQVGGQTTFPDESTRRSRSLLFIALGLASASARGQVPLWIPENGYASLNPPLTPERMGALSTRTTDPLFLHRTTDFLQQAGAHANLSNPFEDATKGEMFTDAAGRVGHDEASQLLSQTHSCAHQRLPLQYGKGPGFPCGACFGCLVRRAAFAAAGLDDRTEYLVTVLDGDSLDGFLERHTEDYKAVQHAASRGITAADVLSLKLPDGHDRDQAAALMNRGLAEVASIELT